MRMTCCSLYVASVATAHADSQKGSAHCHMSQNGKDQQEPLGKRPQLEAREVVSCLRENSRSEEAHVDGVVDLGLLP